MGMPEPTQWARLWRRSNRLAVVLFFLALIVSLIGSDTASNEAPARVFGSFLLLAIVGLVMRQAIWHLQSAKGLKPESGKDFAFTALAGLTLALCLWWIGTVLRLPESLRDAERARESMGDLVFLVSGFSVLVVGAWVFVGIRYGKEITRTYRGPSPGR